MPMLLNFMKYYEKKLIMFTETFSPVYTLGVKRGGGGPCPGGTSYPRIKCPGDSLSWDKLCGGHHLGEDNLSYDNVTH